MAVVLSKCGVFLHMLSSNIVGHDVVSVSILLDAEIAELRYIYTHVLAFSCLRKIASMF